ncbi:trypsin-like peptidase domain-containing protein [Verminephrobacter eiseniae]|uniref:trypsin-like peptidase domain-containing protein n=1 Tax=Verminephrobacter eiseniae TaxID=364317 RepID=UPI002237EECD|nr:trypsin-like peptidase domain-containing protein [Verminephrobacter eiseniae]MCW5231854.1 serine protease [Verminephrobacter eiseniae]MCW5293588.1 serine protease [Verminephrobacter eiseniae]MCW8186118.1 serine protease [Verminephrobacter eiseniae]MCW8224641.1 serine protease [Verminephrobacter eiseniae]MCW8233259.1 serine protease [Verminephrobacter eiseniae]
MKNSGFVARMGMLGALAATLLSGCGGAGQDGAPSAAQTPSVAKVEQVDGRVQPASADQGVPHVKSRHVGAIPIPSRIRLGALKQEEIRSAVSDASPRKLVGLARAVDAAPTLQQLQWQPVAGGGQVAAISVSAEGAHGLRLGIVVRQLPGSAVLRLYRQAAPATVFQISGQEVLQRIESNALAGDRSLDGQTWWTPDLGADEVTLELELPAGADVAALDMALTRVSHIFENLALPTQEEFETKINDAMPCNRDASCENDYADQRNAVARTSFVSRGDAYTCTGTLLNDSQSSGTPYFLSAHHCISSQAEADTLETNWFYRSSSCRSRTLSSRSVHRRGGAKLLYSSDSTDTALLQLNDAPPEGAFFAGWDASAQAKYSSVATLHHPAGDMLKISLGRLGEQTTCTAMSQSGSFDCDGKTGNYYEVYWYRGTTEYGSSGAALLNSAKKVIGTLYGGTSSCFNMSAKEIFGRFDVAYEAGLKKWLAAAPADASNQRVAVHRFYNNRAGTHFFTTNVAERDYVIQRLSDFAYEGVAFYAQAQAQPGSIPMYRFYGADSGAHFFTASAQERDDVKNNMPQYRYEGIAWYASPDHSANTSPVFRFSYKQVPFYTINQAERDFIIAHYREYTYEGPNYYAWTNP